MSEKQRVFVIMSNDYPCRVYADREAANKYVADMNEESKLMVASGLNRRIFYRSYEFEVITT
jgi:hypothetical protein